MRIAAGASTSEHVRSYGASLGVGAAAGPFALATVSRAEVEDVDDAATAVGIAAGYAIDLTADKRVQLCPRASFTHQSGPDVDVGFGTVSSTARVIGLGAYLGGATPLSPSFDFVPYVGATFLSSRISASYADISASESDEYSDIEVGAGFVIAKTLTLQPSVVIPVGLEGAKASFQFVFGVNFGNKSR